MSERCAGCKWCFWVAFSVGCGSSVCYACLKRDYRVIVVDGPASSESLPCPEWCMGKEIGSVHVQEKVANFLCAELERMKYMNGMSGYYLYKALRGSEPDLESIAWFAAFYVVCWGAILLLEAFRPVPKWVLC